MEDDNKGLREKPSSWFSRKNFKFRQLTPGVEENISIFYGFTPKSLPPGVYFDRGLLIYQMGVEFSYTPEGNPPIKEKAIREAKEALRLALFGEIFELINNVEIAILREDKFKALDNISKIRDFLKLDDLKK